MTDTMADLDIDLDELELSFDDAPEKPSRGAGGGGRPGKYDRLIMWLDEKSTKTRKTKEDDEFLPPGIEVGPWTHYPKSKEPVVNVQTQSNLRNRWGKNSDFHKNEGYYFEIVVAGRIKKQAPGAKNPSHYGYLSIRKVVLAPDDTAGSETDAA